MIVETTIPRDDLRREARRREIVRARRLALVRVIVVLSAATGINYIAWRWLASVNWESWWIAVPLVLAETYSLIDSLLFGLSLIHI